MDLPTTVCSQAALTEPGDMAPFHLHAVLQKAHCVAQGQLTPPPSPLDVPQDTLPSRSTTRSKLARLFSGKLPGIKISNKSHRTEPSEDYDILNFGPSSKPQSWEMNDRTPHLITPPKSFERTENTVTRDGTLPFPSLDLRRISRTYEDLREVALEQEKEFRLTLPARSPLHTPLLPSPVIDDRAMYFKSEQSTPFKFENPRPVTHEKNDSSYRTYDDMQIISCYEDGPSASTEDVLNHSAECYTPPQAVVSDENDCPNLRNASSHLCKSVSPAIDGFENSYQLESTDSYRQSLHTMKTRCYQVVEHPLNSRTQKKAEEGRIMLATVLVGPGKPRLVQIQRPPSSVNSVRTSNPSSLSTHSLLQQSSPTRVPPSTPVHQRKEVSAFSPYDTPSVTTPFTDVSRTTLPAMATNLEQTPLSASKLDLVPKPLSFMRSASLDTDRTRPSPADRRLRQLERDLSSTYSRVSGESGRKGGSTVASWTNSNTHQTSVYSRDTFTSVEEGELLDANFNAIATTIDEFPRRMLGLNSPEIINLRRSPSADKDQTHVDNLAKIFLNTPRQLLSVLAAWIIIDSYVSKLCSINTNTPPPSQPMIQKNPTKTIQPHIPKRSVSLGFSKTNLIPNKPMYRLFPLPPKIVRSRTQVDLKHANEMSQESLQSIPTKARSILGLAQYMGTESSEQLLVTRAKAMSVSVGVVAQKLLEVLRGEDGWDPHLWRALAVVVDLTEKGDCDGGSVGPIP